MALPLNNNFEGGSNGSAITTANSGGTSGNAFDGVVIGTGSSVVYSTTQSAHGSFSAKCQTGASSQSAYVKWGGGSTGGSLATVYGRIYIFLTGNIVSGGSRLVEFFSGGDSGTYLGGIAFNPGTPDLAIQDSTFTYKVVFSNTLSLNTWYRVEFQYQFQAGSATVKLFSGDSSTAIETNTASGNYGGSSATCDTIDYGWAFPASNQPALYIDDINANSTGFPGPAVASGPTSTGGFAVAVPAFAGTGQNAETMTGGFAIAPPAFAGNAGPVVPVTSTGSIAVPPPAFAAVGAENFPFPKFILGVKIEVLINGTWTDISTYAYYRSDIVVQRGRPNWATGITASSATLVLNNRDGRFSPVNTNGPYYPYIQRNVQLRISVITMSMTFVPYSGFRFNGEVTVWPPQSDATGNDVYVTVTAYGILQRYQQGAKLGSPINRYYKKTINVNPNFVPLAWWPCDDATGSASMASGLTGGQPITFTGTPSFMSDGTFLGSDPIPGVTGSTWHGQTGASANPPGTGSITEITPGTYTITAPPGVSTFTVAGQGSGGAGGDTDGTKGGSGGGGAEYVTASIGVTPNKSYTYVVPPGGQAVSGGNGGDGLPFTFVGDSQTLTAHGGKGGGYAGAAGGAGGTGSALGTHFNGGVGAVGQSSTTVNQSATVIGKTGATGGGRNLAGTTISSPWTAPVGVSATATVQSWAAGGGGGCAGTTQGATGAGGGAYATGTVNVTAGSKYTPFAGNGGNGASVSGRGDNGGNSGMLGDSGSSVVASGGVGGGTSSVGTGGGVSSGSGNSGGNGGGGAANGSTFGGGGGGGGSVGGPSATGGTGANGNQRGPGNGSGSGGRGGWGAILVNGRPNGGQTNGQTGNQSAGTGGGGGGGGEYYPTGNQGTAGGGGGPGQTTWSWTVTGQPAGGGGGSSAGSAAAGNNGTTGGLGGAAVTGGGAGGAQGMPGLAPGAGGGGAVPSSTPPAAPNTALPPGNGAPGQGTISWNGGTTPPVPENVVSLLLHVDPAGETDGAVLFRFVTYGTVNNVDLIYHTGGKLQLKGFTGITTFFDSGAISTGANGKSLAVQIQLIANGANISWAFTVLDTIAGAIIAMASGTANTISLGNVSDVYVNPTSSMNPSSATAMGGIAVQQYSDTLANLEPMLSGFNGEFAAARVQRLCGEEGIAFTLKGNISDTPQMGPQIDDTFVNLIQYCENADLGQIYEPRELFGIGYRTRVSMQGQVPLILDYGQAMISPPFQPVADAQLTRNDITLSRYLGASVTIQQTTGPMSIQAPPNGVGDYTFTQTDYLFADIQLLNKATFQLALGTSASYRFPTVKLDLARLSLANLIANVGAMDIGDYFQIINPPSWMTPSTIDEIEYGYTENINSVHWNMSINALPEGPYEVPNPPPW